MLLFLPAQNIKNYLQIFIFKTPASRLVLKDNSPKQGWIRSQKCATILKIIFTYNTIKTFIKAGLLLPAPSKICLRILKRQCRKQTAFRPLLSITTNAKNG
jgi:hypothetical protein